MVVPIFLRTILGQLTLETYTRHICACFIYTYSCTQACSLSEKKRRDPSVEYLYLTCLVFLLFAHILPFPSVLITIGLFGQEFRKEFRKMKYECCEITL